MKNKEYWEERAILKDKLLEKDINKIEKKLLKLFKDTRKEVLNELKIIYADIEATEYEKYRIDSLLTSVNISLDNLYKKNEEQITEGLKDTYKRFDKEASIDLGVSFNTINENLIRETIKTKWSGLSFSERIWEHRRRLAFTIKSELSAGLTRGDTLQDISKKISDKFNTSYSNAIRLVRTESCWVMNEAIVNNYKENGIKEYEFMAFLDKKTSPQCRELDGKIINISEYKAGLNFPPLHPNCRSSIVPVIEDIVIEKPKENIKETEEYNATDSLTSKGVKIDLDSFKKIDKKLYEDNAKQLDYLISKYPKAQEYIKNKPFEFKAESMNISTNAYCGTNFDKTHMTIALNTKNYKNYNDLVDNAKKCIENRWSCKGLEEKLSVKTLTHEFGHAIHNVLIDNYNKTHQEEKNEHVKKAMRANTLSASKKKLNQYDEKLVKSFNKEIIKIAKGIDKDLDTKESISKYGKTNPYEFFAECFAEYECHGGTAYAKAMEIFLERNFK